MRKNLLTKIQEYISKKHKKSIWHRIVIVLACVVVFCTTYALILPAITVEEGNKEVVLTEDSNGAKDFKNYITSVTMQHKGKYEQTWKDVENSMVKEGDDLKFNIHYTLPVGTLSENVNSIEYQLPDGVRPNHATSGTVYQQGGQSIGTYTISESGKIIITFDDEYISKNNSLAISGSISFNSSVDNVMSENEDKKDIKFSDEITVGVKVEERQNTDADLKVEKQASKVENDEITYTITVTSENGTNSEVNLVDVMTKIGYDGELTVVDQDNREINVTKPDKGSSEFNITLPQMGENSKYTITYKAKVNELVNGTVDIKNKVTATTQKGDGDNLRKDTEVTTKFTNDLVSKKGELNGDKINWTINVNESGQDIGGWILSDILDGKEYTEKVQISPSIDGKNEITLPYTFPEGSNSRYTITYQTDAYQPIGGNGITNKAILKPQSGNGVESQDSVNAGGGYFDPLTKKAESITKNTDESNSDTANIKWKVTIDATKSTIPAGAVYTDWLEGNQWFTQAQQKNLEDKLNELGYSYSIKWNEQNGKIKGFNITFNDEIPKGTKFEFEYESTGSIGDGSSTVQFINNANINNKVWHKDSIEYEPIIDKYDLNGNNSNDTQHNYYDSALDSNGVLKWGFSLKVPDSIKGQDITITEKLPAEVTLLPEKGLCVQVNGIDSNKTYFSFDESGSATVNVGGYNITATKGDGNSINIQIPSELTNDNSLKNIKFEVKTKINDDHKWTLKDNQYVSFFNNEVVVKDNDDGELGKDSQTQIITKTEQKDDSVIKKSHGNYKDNIIPYSIEVNKEGKDLVEGSDTITLIDELRYSYYTGAEFNASLVHGSVHVYEANPDGSKGNEIKDIKYKLTTDLKNNQAVSKITMTLPDSKHLIVDYKYILASELQINVNLTNKVTLESGSSDLPWESDDKINVEIQDSEAEAHLQGVTIYKVDSENQAIVLNGAEFKLERWSNESKKYVTVKAKDNTDNFISGEDGKIIVDKLAYNTAYRLTETKAPEGYILNNKPYYFIIPNANIIENPVSKPANFNGIEYVIGSTIYVGNDKNSTEITVNKKWFEKDGTEFTGTKDGEISFDLWRKVTKSSSESGEDNLYVDIESKRNWGEDVIQTWTQSYSVKEGTKATLRLTNSEYWGVNEDSYNILINGKRTAPTRIDDNQSEHKKTLVYEFTVSGETSITGYVKSYLDTAWTLEDLEYTPKHSSSDEGKIPDEYCGSYNISYRDNWKITIKNLPRKSENDNGEVFYYTYYVKEKKYPNYTSTYENNDGVASGTITIKNTAEENPEFVLPETGVFAGRRLIILGGVLLTAGSLYIYRRRHE